MKFSESLYFSSNALNRLLKQMSDEAFLEVGLSSSYAFLLMIVHDEPGIQPMKLSNKLQLKPSTITRLVEKMEYRGYLKRRSSGRATHITLTEEGEKLQPKLQRACANMEVKYAEILGKRYVRVLTEMMQKAGEQMSDT